MQPGNLLRDLAIARIAYPKSKAATVRYMARSLRAQVSEDRVYRFLDKLDEGQLTKIVFSFVNRRNSGIFLIFFKATCLKDISSNR